MVEETLQPGASVAVIARRHGVNANQVFHWRKLYRAGKLDVGPAAQLVPVRITEVVSSEQPPAKLYGGVDYGGSRPSSYPHRRCGGRRKPASDPGARGSMISLPAGTDIWIAAGVTDLRRGFTG